MIETIRSPTVLAVGKPALDWDAVVEAETTHTHTITCPERHEWNATPGKGKWTFCSGCSLGYARTALTITPIAPPANPVAATPTKAWEQEMPEGCHQGYCDQQEDRKSAKGDYRMFVFRVESPDGRRGRHTYYVGHRRAEELAATKRRLSENPYCWVYLCTMDTQSGWSPTAGSGGSFAQVLPFTVSWIRVKRLLGWRNGIVWSACRLVAICLPPKQLGARKAQVIFGKKSLSNCQRISRRPADHAPDQATRHRGH
jgi:hypothetical protein